MNDTEAPSCLRRISRLRFTIEPWYLGNGMKELRVQTIVNGTEYNTSVPFEVDDFESQFDWLIDRAKHEILRLVKAHETNHEKEIHSESD